MKRSVMKFFPAKTRISSIPKVGTGINPDSPKDLLLQVSRRLDWRFLLPDPDLNCVAYLGPENDPLIDALLIFSGSLTQIKNMNVPIIDSHVFDLVVVKDPSIQTLKMCANLVKTGGHLYIEANGWSRLVNPYRFVKFILDLFHKNPGPTFHWFPTTCKAIIRRFGLYTVHTYWNWPNFESCTRIIGLDDTHAQTMAFSFQENGIQWLMKKALSRGILPPEWMQYYVPYFSVIARKGSI